jgi:hypothetical protein
MPAEDTGFKNINMNCHKTPETETILHSRSGPAYCISLPTIYGDGIENKL